jgi:hypothetical protein
VKKTEAFNSFTDLPPGSGPQLPVKVEAVGVYGDPTSSSDPARLIFINDNDFFVSGETTLFTEVAVAASAFGIASGTPTPTPNVTATRTPSPTVTVTPTPNPTGAPCSTGLIQSFPAGGVCDPFSSLPNQVSTLQYKEHANPCQSLCSKDEFSRMRIREISDYAEFSHSRSGLNLVLPGRGLVPSGCESVEPGNCACSTLF